MDLIFQVAGPWLPHVHMDMVFGPVGQSILEPDDVPGRPRASPRVKFILGASPAEGAEWVEARVVAIA